MIRPTLPAGADAGAVRIPRRVWLIPAASVMLASACALMLPWIAKAPLLPPLGLMLLLGWRLLRPELWQAWVALPLGAWDDLFSGQPLGSAMTLWTIVFLALDFTDNRTVWHDYWHDLLSASAGLAFCLLGGWLVAGAAGGVASLMLLVPQYTLSVLLMPSTIRLVARLDRLRLAR